MSARGNKKAGRLRGRLLFVPVAKQSVGIVCGVQRMRRSRALPNPERE